MNDRHYLDWLLSEYNEEEIAEREQAEFEAYHHHFMMADGMNSDFIANHSSSLTYVDDLPF